MSLRSSRRPGKGHASRLPSGNRPGAPMNTSLRLPVSDNSQAGEARRLASWWARNQGCTEEFLATMALVVTELATNLALHTRGGVLLLRNLSKPGNCGVELLSLDSGPGVAN